MHLFAFQSVVILRFILNMMNGDVVIGGWTSDLMMFSDVKGK
jgi:hypothetical protein